MSYRKIEGEPNFVKDSQTGAILNINTNEVARQKKLLDSRRQEKAELNQLKSDMSEIKALLSQLIENNKHG